MGDKVLEDWENWVEWKNWEYWSERVRKHREFQGLKMDEYHEKQSEPLGESSTGIATSKLQQWEKVRTLEELRLLKSLSGQSE